MAEIGRLAVWVALLAGTTAVVTRRRLALAVAVAGAAVGTFVLARALVANDFSLVYVADFSRRGASTPYRLASLWGGMAGSLLWFATLVGLAGLLASLRLDARTTGTPGDGTSGTHADETGASGLAGGGAAARNALGRPDRAANRADGAAGAGSSLAVRGGAGTVAAVTGGAVACLAGLVLAFADPYRRLDMPAIEGNGLTPILEHPAMLYHPPLLYLGLASLLPPFALTVAGLLGQAGDGDDWPATVRRWLVIPWGLLAVGMLAGAHWAYVELGWGGYWAWDPVENTALLPWLAVTLALHASVAARHRRNGVPLAQAALVCLAFLLALTGTMLTRSGAVASVHAFAESRSIGRALGALVVVVTVATVALLAARFRSRPGESSAAADRFLPRLLQGHFVVVGTLLGVATIGTLAPLVTDLRGGDGIAIEGRYFASFAGPLAAAGLVLVALVPLALRITGTNSLASAVTNGDDLPPADTSGAGVDGSPVGRRAARRVAGREAVVGGVGFVGGVGLLGAAGGRLDAGAVVMAGAAGAAALSAVVGAVATRQTGGGGRVGGHVAHAGLGLLLLGVAGTASGVTETVPVAPGESVTVLGQEVEYRGVSVDEDVSNAGGPVTDASAVVADIHAAGHDLSPSLVAYPSISRVIAETSLVSGPWRDVQVGLRDADDDGRAVLQIGVHPLQVLVWWGGLVIVVAALVTALEHRPRRRRPSPEQVRTSHTDPLADPPRPPVPLELG